MSKPLLTINIRSLRFTLFRAQLTVAKSEKHSGGRRTWYPVRLRWWPEPGRAYGLIVRRNWEDQGRERELSREDQLRLEQAKLAFRAGNRIACDQSLPDEQRGEGHRTRSQAAHLIAELSRKTYPRR